MIFLEGQFALYKNGFFSSPDCGKVNKDIDIMGESRLTGQEYQLSGIDLLVAKLIAVVARGKVTGRPNVQHTAILKQNVSFCLSDNNNKILV